MRISFCFGLTSIILTLLAGGEPSGPETLKRTLVAREPLLKNPVVVSVDTDGSIYVTETARRLAADLDIREFMQWIPDTLAMRSVEERLAFLRSKLVDGKVKSTSFKDHNKDGVIDVKDLTAISERILRLTDTDGDGMMDRSQVFAEGFNTEVTGIAAGVLAWRGDVYATIIPDLWRLRDTNGSGKADRREALLTGFGVHIAYAGHDMHGLIWGPDGKLYWTIGDKGLNVLSKEGKRWPALAMGSLVRCNPDGTQFEVVARGLRNVQQIAFDDYGNIFGVDNDSDAQGEKERFIYIPEGSDTGWRAYYQYRGGSYNPWMAESIAAPSGENQPAYITPAICSYIDGPSGFARNPGTALNERYRGAFFMTGFPAGLLYSFKTEPDGASFRMVDSHVVDKGPAYVGCNFGPDGALYLADWSGNYPLKEKGAIWKLDDPALIDSPTRREVAAWLKEGPSKVADVDLLKRLKHADQRIRCDAQWELAKRPNGPRLLANAAAEWKEEPLSCTHALWGLTQARVFLPALLETLLSSKQENIRAQAAKWAGETAGTPVAPLVPLLRDASSVVRYHAAVAIGKLGMTEAMTEVFAMLTENGNRDTCLRHAGVMALSGMKVEAVNAALGHSSPPVRLAAAIVCRRQSFPAVERLIDDSDPAVVAEAARAIYDDAGIEAAYPALADLLKRKPSSTEPAIRRSISINRRLGDEPSAIRLTAYAKETSHPAKLRVAALNALASWNVPLKLDPVDGRWNPGPPADRAIAKKAFLAAVRLLEVDADSNVAKTARELARNLGLNANPAELAKEAKDVNKAAELRLGALAGLKAADTEHFNQIAVDLLRDKSPSLRKGAAALLEKGDAVVSYATLAVQRSKDTSERQNAIQILVDSAEPKAIAVLKSLIGSARTLPELQLDLLEVAEKIPELKSEADAFVANLVSEGPVGKFLPALEGGNAVRGREIYETHLAAQCTACHRMGETGSNVGPPLTRVSERGRRYILESLVLPQAKITPGFGVASATLKDGSTITGAPKAETPTALTLLLADGKESVIQKSSIVSQTPAVSPMPSMDGLLSPREIRDLVEYLSTP
jgi:quinoprotein glucose dehydrogenase